MEKILQSVFTMGIVLFAPFCPANAQTAAPRVEVEINFDSLFEWKKPCALESAQLEAKLAALEKIPGKKVYGLDASKSFPQPSHLFNPAYINAYKLKYVAFNNMTFHPESARVMWKNDRIDYVMIRYTAQEGESEAAPELLKSISEALGAPAPARNGKGYVWDGQHFSASASFTVSHGDPIFYVSLRPKKNGDAPVATRPPTITPSEQTPTSSALPAVEINLDHLLDWKNPLDLTKVAFHAIMRQHEKIPGKPVFTEATRGTEESSYIALPFMKDYAITMKAFEGRFTLEGLWITWKDGKADRISVGFPRDPQARTVDKSLMETFEGLFGKNHGLMQSDFDDHHFWHGNGLVVQCFSHRQLNRVSLTLTRANAPVVTAQAAPSVPVVPAVPPQGKVFKLDSFLNWKEPFKFRRETMEQFFQPAVQSLGFIPWHHHSTMTGLGTNSGVSVPMSLFNDKFKVIRAYVSWIESGGSDAQAIVFQFDPGQTTLADEEWLYSELDSILQAPRGKLTVNEQEKGYFWSAKTCYVRVTKKIGEYVDMKIIRPSGFDPRGPRETLSANLDGLLNFASLWNTSPDGFEQLYSPKAEKQEDQKKPPQFEWVNADKSRARFSRQMFSNVETKLTMFGGSIKVEEAILEFVNGKAARATISFYNRGDSGDIEVAEFDRIFKTIGQNLGQVTKVGPKKQLMSANAALPVTGWMWSAPTGVALLEYNEYNTPGKVTKPEFLRLKLAAPNQADWSMGKMATGVQRMELLKRVTKTPEGDVYITGVPMVDQGQKGYCVAASCQRLFEYMRIPCDQHEMAKLVSVDAESGANIMTMQKSLAKIDGAFKVTFKPLVNPELYYSGNGKRRVSDKEYLAIIKDNVDKGVPLLWGLVLGDKPEDPPLSRQTRGGHMRMVIGYNLAKNQVLFTDSWGAGHELKRMALLDAYDVTMGLYSMAPRGL